MFQKLGRLHVVILSLGMLILTFSGCITFFHNAMRGRVRGEHFTFRDPISIDSTKLKLQGYYSRSYWSRTRSWGSRDSVVTRPSWPDTVSSPFVFWKNGTSLSAGATITSVAYDKTYESGHANYLDDLRSVSGERGANSPWAGEWGAFRIRGDSISIQIMDDDVPWASISPYFAEEYNGVILNDTTFVIEEHIRKGDGVDTFSSPDRDTTRMRAVYRFRRLDESEKPSSKNWTQTHPDLQ